MWINKDDYSYLVSSVKRLSDENAELERKVNDLEEYSRDLNDAFSHRMKAAEHKLESLCGEVSMIRHHGFDAEMARTKTAIEMITKILEGILRESKCVKVEALEKELEKIENENKQSDH